MPQIDFYFRPGILPFLTLTQVDAALNSGVIYEHIYRGNSRIAQL